MANNLDFESKGDLMQGMNETSQPPVAPSPVKGGALQTFFKRGFSTLILLSILAVVYFSANVWLYVGIFSLFCGVASWEWTSMFRQAGIKVPAWLVLGAGTLYPLIMGVFSVFTVQSSDLGASYYVLPFLPLVVCAAGPALVAIAAFLWELRKPVEGRDTFLAVTGAVISFIYPVWLFSFSLFALFPVSHEGSEISTPSGLTIFLWVFIVTKIMDIGAYISGSLFGRHRMIPHISPNKTWEGFAGACVITILTGVWLGTLFWPEIMAGYSFPYVELAVLSLIIGLISVVGDLAGSLIKRSLGVKDSGKLLPGIGGVFDLIDSPAFTFPVFIFAVFVTPYFNLTWIGNKLFFWAQLAQ